MGIDIIFKIAAVGLITAIINQILKKADKDEIATLVRSEERRVGKECRL